MQTQFFSQNKSVQRICLWIAIVLLLQVWALSMLSVSQISTAAHIPRVPVAFGMPALDAASKDALSSGQASTCLVRADYCGNGA